jgi:hypothetical protein
MTTRLPTAVVNALADAAVDRLDAGSGPGYVEIRTGSQPATANTAASGTLLATVVLADPAFGSAVAGVATATDPAPVAAVAAGTAGWFRAFDSTGATVHDGAVTATGGGGEMTLASTALTVGISVDVTSYTWTQPAS